MRARPADGARILVERGDLDMTAIVAYEHRRRFDGTGYPHLQYAHARALASRVVGVCDVYDASCPARPYRQAWTSDRAAAYLRDHAGTEFDRRLVDAFTAMLAPDDVEVVVLRHELKAVRVGPASPVSGVEAAAQASEAAGTPWSSGELTIEFM